MKLVKDIAEQYKDLVDKKFTDDETKVYLSDSYLKRIGDCVKYWKEHSWTDLAKKELNSLLHQPSTQNGALYEILAYQWFHANQIHVEYQPRIEKEDSLKSTGSYDADGRLDGEIIFDIKSFSFGQPRYAELQNALNEMWQEERKKRIAGKKGEEQDVPDYYITVSGNSNLSSETMGKLLERKQDIYKELFLESHGLITDYILSLKDEGLEIRASFNQPGKTNIHIALSEANAYQWAKENCTQVLYHCSQFCRNKRYFLMYPYDSEKARHYYSDDRSRFEYFRILMRRTFIGNLKNERFINGYDGKADKDMRVCEAIRKLSGVFFLDVTNEYEYSKNNGMLFLNPNADNPLCAYQVNYLFRQQGVDIEDYYYDNY